MCCILQYRRCVGLPCADGSTNDWGYKITVAAKTFKKETVPQSRVLAEIKDSLTFLCSLEVCSRVNFPLFLAFVYES